jgi:hypothetical protein
MKHTKLQISLRPPRLCGETALQETGFPQSTATASAAGEAKRYPKGSKTPLKPKTKQP